jgi:glutamyl-tRNA synthetase
VRFAPSPTGYLHIGGARTALFNWLFARHHGGVFILRIEDTDKERSTPEALSAIVEGLQWLGLDWDEGPGVGGAYGPYNQMARLEIYRREADRLLTSEAAYKCFCTPEELDRMREEARAQKLTLGYSGRCRKLSPAEVADREAKGMPFALRFRVPSGITSFDDMVRGRISFDNSEIDDFIILRSDGTPTYNFSVSVDDVTMEISHVIRGEDHISNTPKQIMLLRALGAKPPEYGHVSLIMGEDGSRLSKRHGATAVSAYEQMGYLPEAMVNYLALLGWSPKDDREIMSRDELVREFDISGVAKTAAIFNPKKLEWMNGMYIRSLSDEELAERVAPFLVNAGLLSDGETREKRDWLAKLAHATKERLHRLTDIVPWSEFFFRDIKEYEEKGIKKYWSKPDAAKRLKDLADIFLQCQTFEHAVIDQHCRAYLEREGINLGELIHPARLALTGKTVGPGFFETAELLGKDKALDRLQRAIQHIENNLR